MFLLALQGVVSTMGLPYQVVHFTSSSACYCTILRELGWRLSSLCCACWVQAVLSTMGVPFEAEYSPRDKFFLIDLAGAVLLHCIRDVFSKPYWLLSLVCLVHEAVVTA